MSIVTEDGRHCSPTEFEKLAGKATAKKWKASIRVLRSNGRPGVTMQDWLIDQGLEKPRAPKGAEGGEQGLLDAVRRRHNQAHLRQLYLQQADGTGAGPAGGLPGGGGGGAAGEPLSPDGGGGGGGGGAPTYHRHRPGCMCVICKQSRRKTGAPDELDPLGDAARSGGVGAAAQQQQQQRTPGADGRRPAGPAIRAGKRAYMCATPNLLRGPMQHRLWQVPLSSCCTPEDYFAELGLPADGGAGAEEGEEGAQQQQPEEAGQEGAQQQQQQQQQPPASAAAPAPAPAGGAAQQQHEASAAPAAPAPPAPPAAAAAAAAAAADPSADIPRPACLPALAPAQPQAQQLGDEPASATAAAVAAKERAGKLLLLRDRLRTCRATEPARITFGKSGIHGWGMFAKKPMAQDSMIFEFRWAAAGGWRPAWLPACARPTGLACPPPPAPCFSPSGATAGCCTSRRPCAG
jgi:hypothetical protein